MKNIIIDKKMLTAKAIEVTALRDDVWSLVSRDGERLEDVLYKTGIEDYEELVKAIKSEYPELADTTFEEA